LSTVCASTYSSPAQNTPSPIRTGTSLRHIEAPAQTKYTMMLRLVSCTASQTLVRPVSSWNRWQMRSVTSRMNWSM
jgi:hypothetical protein